MSVSAIRADWLSQLVREFQIVAGEIATRADDRLLSRVAESVTSIAAPCTPAEHVLFRSFLLELDLRLRAGLSTEGRVSEAFSASGPIPSWMLSTDDPRESFLSFIRTRLKAGNAGRADTPVSAAKRVMETQHAKPLTVPLIARHVGVHWRQLNRRFAAETGRSITFENCGS